MSVRETHISYLLSAELQFRLASAVRLAVTGDRQPLDLPIEWTHGSHRVRYEEIALRPDQADYAACFVHRSAIFLMAVAVKDAIEAMAPSLAKALSKASGDIDGTVRGALQAVQPKPWKASDTDVGTAYHVARLIRNAFAHAPFAPTWMISTDLRDNVFAIPKVISLATKGLHGTAFDWRHYGGPLALFLLCRFVRTEILQDEVRPRTAVPAPARKIYQQGEMILEQVEAIPPDALPSDSARHPDGGINLGGGYVVLPSGKT